MTSAVSQPMFATRSKVKRPARSAQKSAISNGTRLLPGTGNRSPWVRRCKDLMSDLISDRGGASELSAAQASIVRRAAVLSVELESMETTFAKDGQASASSLDLYARVAGNLRRLLETLGIERSSKNITPLADILKRLDGEAITETGDTE